MTTRLTLSAAALVVGAGVVTGFAMGGGEDEPISKNRVPATADPRDPPPTAVPSSPKPSKTTTPPAPAPATTPPPAAPSPTPSPTESATQPVPGISEAEWALELAEEFQERYGTPPPSHWEEGEQGYQYEQNYQEGEYQRDGYYQDEYQQDGYYQDGQR